MSARRPLPRWADVALLPVLNLVLALIVFSIFVLLIGQNPLQALAIMINGAFGYGEGVGFTLHFATSFVFTGLCVAVAAHAGLFNIGGEGQAYVASLGAIAVGFALDHVGWLVALPYHLSFLIVLPLAILAAMILGAAWAFIPGYLQAKRGSHVVITTIMFNFIASSLMAYLLVYVLKPQGVQEPSTANVVAAGKIPQLRELFPWLNLGGAPLNVTVIFAVLALIGVYVLIWRTKFGYALRTMGHSPSASLYAGISNSRMIILVMMISGGLAGMVAVNEVLGVQSRIVIDVTAGYGFVGIAVALMGRNHPIGIALAAILFGALYQGGLDLQFYMPAITRDMIVVIQALVIMFTGAMEGLLRPGLETAFMLYSPRQKAEAAARETVGTEG
jgi:simple sugar transport system permease protein